MTTSDNDIITPETTDKKYNETFNDRIKQFNDADFIVTINKRKKISKIDLVDAFRNIFKVKTLSSIDGILANLDSYYYDDGYYKIGTAILLKKLMYNKYKYYVNGALYSEYKDLLEGLTIVNHNYFDDKQKQFININNGVYNIKTDTFTPHHASYHFTYKTPVNYKPDAHNELFERKVKEIVGEFYTLTMQELFGYCLYTDYHVQKALMWVGDGANGKDVLSYCLSKLVGNDNISAEGLKTLVTNRFSSVELQHKLLNLSGETPNNFKINNSDMIKSLRGGTIINGERKHGNRVKFRNYAKLVFLTNKVPETNDYSFGFFRSWVIIPFENQFTGDKDNKNLKYELTDTDDKMSGILNWALEGLKRLLEQGHFTYNIGEFGMEEYWKRLSEPAISFIMDEVEDGTLAYNGEIIKRYTEYCKEYKVQQQSTKSFWISWNNNIRKYFPDAEKFQDNTENGEGKRGWRNICF